MHHTLKHWIRLIAPMAAAVAMLTSLTASQARAGHDDDYRWYAPRYKDHDWHGGKHHDWHSGPHVGPHRGVHFDPWYGWHGGEHYGPHKEPHHDWHRGAHHDWYGD